MRTSGSTDAPHEFVELTRELYGVVTMFQAALDRTFPKLQHYSQIERTSAGVRIHPRALSPLQAILVCVDDTCIYIHLLSMTSRRGGQ